MEVAFLTGIVLGIMIGILINIGVNIEVVKDDNPGERIAKWRRIVGVLLERGEG